MWKKVMNISQFFWYKSLYKSVTYVLSTKIRLLKYWHNIFVLYAYGRRVIRRSHPSFVTRVITIFSQIR